MTIDSQSLACWLMQQLEGLEAHQAQRLAALAKERTWESGDCLFEENDEVRALYLVMKGRIFLGSRLLGVSGVSFASAGPGDFVGWSAVVPPHRATAHARVITTTRMLVLDGRQLMALWGQDPALGCVLMRRLLVTVTDRLQDMRQRMVEMLGSDSIRHMPG